MRYLVNQFEKETGWDVKLMMAPVKLKSMDSKRFGKAYNKAYILWLESKIKNSKQNDDHEKCENPVHNIQIEADGHCHWCRTDILKKDA